MPCQGLQECHYWKIKHSIDLKVETYSIYIHAFPSKCTLFYFYRLKKLFLFLLFFFLCSCLCHSFKLPVVRKKYYKLAENFVTQGIHFKLFLYFSHSLKQWLASLQMLVRLTFFQSFYNKSPVHSKSKTESLNTDFTESDNCCSIWCIYILIISREQWNKHE